MINSMLETQHLKSSDISQQVTNHALRQNMLSGNDKHLQEAQRQHDVRHRVTWHAFTNLRLLSAHVSSQHLPTHFQNESLCVITQNERNITLHEDCYADTSCVQNDAWTCLDCFQKQNSKSCFGALFFDPLSTSPCDCAWIDL